MTALLLLAWSSLAFSATLQSPSTPDVLLTEVLFDQTGDDSLSEFGSEWIEIFTSTSLNLDQLEIRDNLGNAFGTLPSHSVPANTYIHVVLGGQAAYFIDSDASDGGLALTLGLPAGDLLPNAQQPSTGGGVRLLQNGVLIDDVYWGHGSAPQGSLGEFVDLSFATGTPINEGDSIGRSGDPLADYTGGAADWDRNGGCNAAGPTPGGRNGVYPNDKDSILKWTQSGVCDIVNAFGYMTGRANTFYFVDATVDNILVDQTGGGLTVTATHTFYLQSRPAPVALSGIITTVLSKNETVGSVGFTRTAIGNLTTPNGGGFSIDYSQTIGGLHTNVQTSDTSVSVVFTDAGQSYPYGHVATKSMGRTSDNTWVLLDSRTGEDYGGAGPKTSSAVALYTRLSDGVVSTVFDLQRDMPIGPPMPGTTDSIDFIQHIAIESVASCLDDYGTEDTVIQRYDEFNDGVLVATLQPEKCGTTKVSINAISAREPFGSTVIYTRLPFNVNGQDTEISLSSRGKLGVEPNGTWYAESANQMNADGQTVNQFRIWADPPLLGNADTDSADSGGGFGDAAVNCATKGGAIGGGVGAVAGGIAGALGGGAVGTAVGAVGGPPGAVALAAEGGVAGASVGTLVGSAAGAVAGGGIGAAVCMAGYGIGKTADVVVAAWDWLTEW